MQSHMIVMKKAIVLVFIALSHVRAARPNVVFGFEDEANNPVKNWDFEYSPSSSDWQVKDAEAINVTGGYNGGSCFRITQRSVTHTHLNRDPPMHNNKVKVISIQRYNVGNEYLTIDGCQEVSLSRVHDDYITELGVTSPSKDIYICQITIKTCLF